MQIAISHNQFLSLAVGEDKIENPFMFQRGQDTSNRSGYHRKLPTFRNDHTSFYSGHSKEAPDLLFEESRSGTPNLHR